MVRNGSRNRNGRLYAFLNGVDSATARPGETPQTKGTNEMTTMSIERAKEILAETAWKRPSDYGGHNPVGEYVIATRTRDSSILEDVNYSRILEDLEELNEPQRQKIEDAVYDFRAGHWACGWVEYLMVKPEAPDDVLIASAETISALADYPVYDEDTYSEKQHDAVTEHWVYMGTDERVQYCQSAGVSIFEARHDIMPDNVFDLLSAEIH